MITVHHLNDSRSQRVLWLLEEMGLPYEVTRYQRDAKTMLAPPALKAIHPLGKSPVIEDMAAAYGWADLAVCRAGALTIAELTAAGLGAVLVPFPHAVDDHQTGNAQALVGNAGTGFNVCAIAALPAGATYTVHFAREPRPEPAYINCNATAPSPVGRVRSTITRWAWPSPSIATGRA